MQAAQDARAEVILRKAVARIKRLSAFRRGPVFGLEGTMISSTLQRGTCLLIPGYLMRSESPVINRVRRDAWERTHTRLVVPSGSRTDWRISVIARI